MTIDMLCNYLCQGREIEFSLYNNDFFVSKVFDDKETYYIYDDTQKRTLIKSEINDILNYEFVKNISFSKSINSFVFKYVL